MDNLTKVAVVLANIGAINWGLKALSDQAELVQYLQVPWLIRIVYGIVGIAGLYCLIKFITNKSKKN